MKLFWNLLLVIFILTGLVACNQSKDEEKQIIGTWIYLNSVQAKLFSFDEYHEYVCYEYKPNDYGNDADSGMYEIFPEKNTIILFPSNSDSKPRKIKYEKINSDSLVEQLNWYDHTYTNTYLKMSASRYLPKANWHIETTKVVEPADLAEEPVVYDTVFLENGDTIVGLTALP